MKINLLCDLVLIRRTAGAEMSAGGIAIPMPEELQQGEVVAVGPGKKVRKELRGQSLYAYWTDEPASVKVGDTVLFSPHGHQTTRVEGEEFVITHEASIMGVLVEEDEIETAGEKLSREFA